MKISWINLFLNKPHSFRERLLFTLTAAVSFGLIFPPYGIVILVFPALILFYIGLKDATGGDSARLASVFSIVAYLLHTYWFASFHLLALPAVLVALVIHFGLWGYVIGRIGLNPWIGSAGWILLQIAVGGGYLAFPWSRITTALAVEPVLIQAVRWSGELVWGGLIALLCFLVSDSLYEKRRNTKSFLVVGVTILVLSLFSFYEYKTIELNSYTRPIRLIQPNIQSTFNTERSTSQFDKLVKLTRKEAEAGEFIIWPETAVSDFPFVIDERSNLKYKDPIRRWQFQNVLKKGNNLFFGNVFYHPQPGKLDFLNGAVMLDSSGMPVGYYTKRYPVPGGEHLPMMGQWEWVESLGQSLGTMGYRRGTLGGLMPVRSDGEKIMIGTQICFEDAFNGLVRDQVLRGAKLLINISNDSWSRSEASHRQHFYRAKIRAVEMGRTMIRNGNTGISAVVDPLGNVRNFLDVYESGTLSGKMYRPLDGTLFLQWGSWIRWISVILMLIAGYSYKFSQKP